MGFGGEFFKIDSGLALASSLLQKLSIRDSLQKSEAFFVFFAEAIALVLPLLDKLIVFASVLREMVIILARIPVAGLSPAA